MDNSKTKPSKKARKSQVKKKPAVNAHTYCEFSGTGRISWEALEQIREFLAKWEGAQDDPQKQSEQQKDK